MGLNRLSALYLQLLSYGLTNVRLSDADIQVLATRTDASARFSALYLQVLGQSATGRARLSAAYLQALGLSNVGRARLSDVYLQILTPGHLPRLRTWPMIPFLDPRLSENPSDILARGVFRFKTATGGFRVETVEPLPSAVMDYPLLLDAPAEVDALVSWFRDTAVGRLKPTLVPTFHLDLTPAVDHASGFTNLTIRFAHYTERLFPSVARQTIAFVSPDDVLQRTVTASVDNGDGTETLTLSSAVPLDVTPDTVVCFVRLMRLNDDRLAVEYLSPTVAQATLSFIELPGDLLTP